MERDDKKFMRLAIKKAVASKDKGDVPFGAVVVREGKVIAAVGNGELRYQDVTQHAEVRAISLASKRLGRRDLSDCTIYSTVEPCPMCSGAIFYSCVKRVVCGMTRDDLPHLFRSRKIRFMDLANDLNYNPEIATGVCRDECIDIFVDYKKAFRVNSVEPVDYQRLSFIQQLRLGALELYRLIK